MRLKHEFIIKEIGNYIEIKQSPLTRREQEIPHLYRWDELRLWSYDEP